MSRDCSKNSNLAIVFENQFEGSDEPIIPELKWFADNQEILSLIDMRCGDKPNSIKKYSVNIDASQCSSLNESQAAKIDAALNGAKLKGNVDLHKNLKSAIRKTLSFEIEF